MSHGRGGSTSSGLPDGVERFLSAHVGSIELLEVLLLLHGAPERSWTSDETSAQLRIHRDSAQRRLLKLAADALVVEDASRAGAYRFASERAGLTETVTQVEQAYRERRVAVVTFIFSRPVDDVFVFADAFKVKKGK